MTTTVEWNGDAAKALIDRATREGGAAASISLGSDIRTSMPGDGAGPIGETKTGRTLWKPSTPGEPPGLRTGELRGSVQVNGLAVSSARTNTVPNLGGDPGRFQIGTADDKASWLEYGTVNMPARPFMRPMLKSNRTHRRMVQAFIARATRVLGSAGSVGGA